MELRERPCGSSPERGAAAGTVRALGAERVNTTRADSRLKTVLVPCAVLKIGVQSNGRVNTALAGSVPRSLPPPRSSAESRGCPSPPSIAGPSSRSLLRRLSRPVARPGGAPGAGGTAAFVRLWLERRGGGSCHQGDSEGSRRERPFLGRKKPVFDFLSHRPPPLSPASPRNNKLKGRFCFPRCSRRGGPAEPGAGQRGGRRRRAAAWAVRGTRGRLASSRRKPIKPCERRPL